MGRGGGGLIAGVLSLVLGIVVAAHADEPVVLDGFDAASGWTVAASPGTKTSLAWERDDDGTALRLDYDLANASGFVILRHEVRRPLPENFAFRFRLRGQAPRGTFEFKLVDPDGNVWWRRMPGFTLPRGWQTILMRRSRLTHAWGPDADAGPRAVAAIEIAMSGGEPGPGTLWLDDLALEPREPIVADGAAPVVTASSTRPGSDPARAVDGAPATSWKSAPEDATAWLMLDFGRNRELGGLVLDWDPTDHAVAYAVETSLDGTTWTPAFRTETGKGNRAWIYMPDTEARFVRLDLQRSSRGRGFGVANVAVKPVQFSDSPNAFFSAIAYDSPPGLYPKYLLGKQTYWTVVGVDGGVQEALVNEEGMVEIDRAFSIEPFLHARGRLVTWHDAEIWQEQESGALPVVVWRHEGLRLRLGAFASGPPEAPTLYLRYRVDSQGGSREQVKLFLAIRPFQVLPPWQALNMQGGVAQIHELGFDGQAVWVDRTRPVVPVTRPSGFGAATFEDGAIPEYLVVGVPPADQEVSDPFGFASGALEFRLRVEPGRPAEVAVAVPLHETASGALPAVDAKAVAAEHDAVKRQWTRLLGRTEVSLPPAAEPLARTLRSTIAYTLVNRDRAALQPGSRTYARSWIRDGAMESEALLQMGFTQEVRDFLRWYAGFQAPNGAVPCCVDQRGADWTPEHDSEGAFIYALAEYYRYTRDAGFVHDLWPHVQRAVARIAALRAERMGSAWREPDKRAYFGLLPESISHEGYSGHPVHAYWDDFFALRGLKDAAALAVVVGDDAQAAEYAQLRDAFRETLLASLQATMAMHHITYLPGSVELGDFDPTSTSIAIVPGGELERLPPEAVRDTYDRYWAEIESRMRGTWSGVAYSPYELRNVAAFVRLGQRERAHALLDYLMADRRPAAWNQWAEVVWIDRDLPRFIGDMPHTWVGAGFVQAVRNMLAYERESDQALVLAAGLKPAWLAAEDGVAVRRLPTHWGVLNYTIRADGPDVVRLRISGDLVVPPGKIVVPSPLPRPITAVTVNGVRVADPDPSAVRLDASPADVEIRYDAAPRAAEPAR